MVVHPPSSASDTERKMPIQLDRIMTEYVEECRVALGDIFERGQKLAGKPHWLSMFICDGAKKQAVDSPFCV